MRTTGYFSWTSKMDLTLSACLKNQMEKGNGRKLGWNREAWCAVINALRKECGATVTEHIIADRLRTWAKHYSTVSAVLSTPGFSWNYEKGRIEVAKEQIWIDYVKEHPEAILYRRRITIVNWDDICELFSEVAPEEETEDGSLHSEEGREADEEDEDVGTKDTDETNNGDEADGANEADGTNEPAEADEGDETSGNNEKDETNGIKQTNGVNMTIEISESNDEDEEGRKDDSIHSQANGEKSERETLPASFPASCSKKRKVSGSEDLHALLTRMADSLERFLKSEPPKATIQIIMDELSKVDSLDETTYVKAADLFMQNQRKFDTFAGLPNTLKRRFLDLQFSLL